MAQLTLRAVEKSYGEARVIHGVDLDVADGEFVVFVGPSGCGKSTLLRMIAGLEEVTAGEVSIGAARVNELSPSERGIAMVFQSYALYPHKDVYGNMAFALRHAGEDKRLIDERVRRAADILGLDALLHRRPKELSGGQRQRVAIGRAIVRDPAIFLFDEPLSNLDAALRVQMRVEILRLHQRLGTTMVYVTHDQVEAMTLADRIVVLRAGSIEQVGTPLELYHHPRNRFVAGFIGSPKMNFLDAAAEGRAGAGLRVRLPDASEIAVPVEGEAARGAPLTLGVRPEHVRVADPSAAALKRRGAGGGAAGGRDAAPRRSGRPGALRRQGRRRGDGAPRRGGRARPAPGGPAPLRPLRRGVPPRPPERPGAVRPTGPSPPPAGSRPPTALPRPDRTGSGAGSGRAASMRRVRSPGRVPGVGGGRRPPRFALVRCGRREYLAPRGAGRDAARIEGGADGTRRRGRNPPGVASGRRADRRLGRHGHGAPRARRRDRRRHRRRPGARRGGRPRPAPAGLALAMGAAPERTVLMARLDVPSRTGIDRPPLPGAAIFGAGLRLGGFRPGPAWTAPPPLAPGTLAFVPAMLLGLGPGGRAAGTPPARSRGAAA